MAQPLLAAQVPELTNAIQVINLPNETADLHCPVRLHGVVTYADPHGGYGFVQDRTAGAVVFWPGSTPPVQAGQRVEVLGSTSTNVYSPIIGSAVFHVLGKEPFPTPLKASYGDLYTGHADCQWTEVEGEVRSATTNSDFLILMLAIADHRFSVSVLTKEELNPERWVGARIRVRGVTCGAFNEKGLYVDAEMLSPSLDQLAVLKPPPSDPYALPLTPVATLGHKAELAPGQRIHVQGVVTAFLPGDALYVRDQGATIEVQTAQTRGADVGDRVDIVGFYERKASALVIEDANFRRLSSGPAPQPLEASLGDLMGGRLDAELVKLPARLLEWQHGPDERIMELQSSNVIFRARLANDPELEELPVGSLVEVSGVCRNILDRNENAVSFELRMRSTADLAQLQPPSWWTSRHVFWVSGALLVAGVFILGWAGLLKQANTRLERKVAERTGQLQGEIADRQRAEVALRESEALYHSLVKHLPAMIVRKDTAGRYLFVNTGFCRHVGFSEKEILGKTALEFLPREQAERVIREDRRVMESGETTESDEQYADADGQLRIFRALKTPVRNDEGQVVGIQSMFMDITARKQAESNLEQAQRDLIKASRQAGMAEVATGVLHNVGNVLNSLNVSANLIGERVRNSRVNSIGRVAGLFKEHGNGLAEFLTSHPTGRRLPEYVQELSEVLAEEHAVMLKETKLINNHIEHIKQIVTMQQNYARVSAVVEKVQISELAEDALRMVAGGLERYRIRIDRDYPSHAPTIVVDKHKVLQILVNLLRNAKHACQDSSQAEKFLKVKIRNGGERVSIAVSDNGVGIPAENLVRIFSHGFTTRKDGHGFGLHSGALAAREMGGSLTAHSDGAQRGATFTLDLPLQPPGKERAEAATVTATNGKNS